MAILGFNRRLAALSAAACMYALMALGISLGPPRGGAQGPQLGFRAPKGSLAIRAVLLGAEDEDGLLTLRVETLDGAAPELVQLGREGEQQQPAHLPDNIRLEVVPAPEERAGRPPAPELLGRAQPIELPGPGFKILTRHYLLALTKEEIRVIPRAMAERRQGRIGDLLRERRDRRGPGREAPPEEQNEPGPPPR